VKKEIQFQIMENTAITQTSHLLNDWRFIFL